MSSLGTVLLGPPNHAQHGDIISHTDIMSIGAYRFNSLAPFSGIPLRICHIPITRICPESEEMRPSLYIKAGAQERLEDILDIIQYQLNPQNQSHIRSNLRKKQ